MGETVALNFEDGVTRFVECRAGETVADAAYRVGVNIPLDCRDGACGTCKGHCESGEYDAGSYIDEALTDDEARAGYVLCCQMRPKTDCVVNIPVPSAMAKTKAVAHEGRIVALNRLSSSTLSLTLEGPALAYLPGQYVSLDVPGTSEHRAYSFANYGEGGKLKFLLRVIPNGLMSTYLTETAKIGDVMRFTGPLGAFYLRPVKRPVLMLAGGTGLAPFLAMLDKLANEGCDQPLHLVYGVNTDADLVEMERLDYLAARLPTLRVVTTVADPASAHQRHGFVTAHLDAIDPTSDVYLCGPPPMVEAVRADFARRGIAPSSFHFEKFSASAA